MSYLSVGLDPSYHRFGFAAAFIKREEKIVYVAHHRNDKGSEYLFPQCYELALEKQVWLREVFQRSINQAWNDSFNGLLSSMDTFVVMEIPPPVGQFSAGLYLLGGIVRQQVALLRPADVFYIYPAQLSALIPGKITWEGKSRKGNSTLLAKAILEENPDVHLVKGRKQWNHDEAEAFLMCVLGANNRGPFSFKLPPYLETEKWDLEYYARKEEENRKKRDSRKRKRSRKEETPF